MCYMKCKAGELRATSLQYSFENTMFTWEEQLGNLLPLCREIAGARDILQKFENLKKQDEWNFNLWFCIFMTAIKEIKL